MGSDKLKTRLTTKFWCERSTKHNIGHHIFCAKSHGFQINESTSYAQLIYKCEMALSRTLTKFPMSDFDFGDDFNFGDDDDKPKQSGEQKKDSFDFGNDFTFDESPQ